MKNETGEGLNSRFTRLSGQEAIDAIDIGPRRIESLGDFAFKPDLGSVAKAVTSWQNDTFGPPETRTGCTARLEHLRREAVEAIEASGALDRSMAARGSLAPECRESDLDALASELADIGILLLSACSEALMDLGVIMYRKLTENRARTWSKPDAAGVIEHIKGDS